MSDRKHATRSFPVVTFPDFPMPRTLGELRLSVIDCEHLAGWFDVGSSDAGDAVRHACAVLTLIGAFCFAPRRPKAERWSRTRPAHLIAAPVAL